MSIVEFKQRILPHMTKDDIVDLFRKIILRGRIQHVAVDLAGFTYKQFVDAEPNPLADDPFDSFQEYTADHLFKKVTLSTVGAREDSTWESDGFVQAAQLLLVASDLGGGSPAAFMVHEKKKLRSDIREEEEARFLGVPVMSCSQVNGDRLVLLMREGPRVEDIRYGYVTGVRS